MIFSITFFKKIFSIFLFNKPLLNFSKKKNLLFAVSSAFIDVDLLGNVEIWGPRDFHTKYFTFFNDDLTFLAGDLFILWIISILLIFGAFNHVRKFHYTVSQYLIKLFVILLFFLSLIYFQFLSIFENTFFNFKIVLFNDMLILDLNTLLFRFFSIIILFFCCIIFFNYTSKYFILPFEYLIIILTSVFGMFWFVSSLNFMVFFVGLEAQALSFYILSSIKKNSNASAESGLKYFVLGAISSAFVLLSIFYFYLHFGTFSFYDLNMISSNILEYINGMFQFSSKNIEILYDDYEDLTSLQIVNLLLKYTRMGFDLFDPVFSEGARHSLYIILREEAIENVVYLHYLQFQIAFIFLCTSFFFKISAAPFHIWSPDVYEGAPLPTTQIFATLAKFAIFCVLLRFIFLFNFLDSDFTLINNFFRIVIVSSIIVGTFHALMEQRIKKFLAYSSITHTGYMLFGFANGSFEGILGSVSYLIAYLLLNCIVWGFLLIYKKNQKLIVYLIDFSNLLNKNFLLALSFLLIISSMAGFPPFLFFYLKLKIFMSSGDDFLLFLIIAIFTTISAFYYLRLIKITFFEQQLFSKNTGRVELTPSLSFSVVLGTYLMLFLSINPQIILDLSKFFIISLNYNFI